MRVIRSLPSERAQSTQNICFRYGTNGVTRRIYVVDMQILKSEFSLLGGITINGVALKGFEPEVFEYTTLYRWVLLPFRWLKVLLIWKNTHFLHAKCL